MTKEAMEHVFKQAAAQSDIRTEIRCSPHTARHYFAQTHLRNGLDVYSVSRLLGHENINITKRYLQSICNVNIKLVIRYELIPSKIRTHLGEHHE